MTKTLHIYWNLVRKFVSQMGMDGFWKCFMFILALGKYVCFCELWIWETLVKFFEISVYTVQKNTFVEFAHSIYLKSNLLLNICFATNVCLYNASFYISILTYFSLSFKLLPWEKKWCYLNWKIGDTAQWVFAFQVSVNH